MANLSSELKGRPIKWDFDDAKELLSGTIEGKYNKQYTRGRRLSSHGPQTLLIQTSFMSDHIKPVAIWTIKDYYI